MSAAALAPSRRGLLRIAATTAAAAGAAASPVTTSGADAELIALCDKVLALDAELDRLFELQCAAEAAGDEALERFYFDRQVASVPALHGLLARIAPIPAGTEAAKRAKARVLLTRVQYDLDGTPCEEGALAHSLCRDVLAFGGAA